LAVTQRPTCRPGLVGDHELPVAVVVLDLELGEGAELVAVDRASVEEAEPAAVPAVAERQHDFVRRR